ncbi:PaaI family thioesterase [Actinomadura sp. HBU206391]|nr:PaaI family thioesterase [Actinomadura sp. HBU206391]
MEHIELTADRVELACEITPDLLQPYGIAHGGLHCSLVETAASYGAAIWFHGRGQVVGVANHTNFLRAARTGRLKVVAIPIHRGRTQQLWQVDITDDTGRAVARGEVRLANIASADALARPESPGAPETAPGS